MSRTVAATLDASLIWNGSPVVVSCVCLGARRPEQHRWRLPARGHESSWYAATLMLEANVNPRVVQEMLGHANIRQTMDTYSHVLPSMQQAAARMDEMLG
jgi:integrase